MQWSTPSGVANGEALQLLPNELYPDIFDYVDHTYCQLRNPTLKSLALVCRYFHDLAIPRLYRTVKITSGCSAPNTFPFEFIYTCLKRTPPFAYHVQDFSLSSMDLTLSTRAGVLGQLPNLQSLTLNSVTVDAQFLKSICRLRYLKSLSFSDVLFDLFVHSDEDLLSQKLAIQELSVTNPKFYTGYSPLRDFMSYIVDVSQLKSLTVSHWTVTKGIFLSMETSSLVKLIVNNVKFYDKLLDFLENSESLEILELGDFARPEGVFPPPSLPKLRRLVCPSFMLYLVTGRPISSIKITTDASSRVTTLDGMTADTLSLIKGSSAILKDIAVPLDFYHNVAIFEASPHIERLHIDISKWTPPDKETWLETIVYEVTSRCPQILHSLLSFSLEHTNRVSNPTEIHIQRDLLHQLTLIFPNLLEAQLLKPTQWRRVTIKDGWIYDSV